MQMEAETRFQYQWMNVLFSTLSHDVLMARERGKAAEALTHRISGVAESPRQASAGSLSSIGALSLPCVVDLRGW